MLPRIRSSRIRTYRAGPRQQAFGRIGRFPGGPGRPLEHRARWRGFRARRRGSCPRRERPRPAATARLAGRTAQAGPGGRLRGVRHRRRPGPAPAARGRRLTLVGGGDYLVEPQRWHPEPERSGERGGLGQRRRGRSLQLIGQPEQRAGDRRLPVAERVQVRQVEQGGAERAADRLGYRAVQRRSERQIGRQRRSERQSRRQRQHRRDRNRHRDLDLYRHGEQQRYQGRQRVGLGHRHGQHQRDGKQEGTPRHQFALLSGQPRARSDG
jgi:hypothetical protein